MTRFVDDLTEKSGKKVVVTFRAPGDLAAGARGAEKWRSLVAGALAMGAGAICHALHRHGRDADAGQYFGSEFLISVPVVLFGRPDKISFPRHLKNFVIPITWRSHRSYLIICLERAGAERDAPPIQP